MRFIFLTILLVSCTRLTREQQDARYKRALMSDRERCFADGGTEWQEGRDGWGSLERCIFKKPREGRESE